MVDGFTRQYGLKRLVYAEPHEDIGTAIQREKALKHWSRAWKVRLILDANGGGGDLYDRVAELLSWRFGRGGGGRVEPGHDELLDYRRNRGFRTPYSTSTPRFTAITSTAISSVPPCRTL